ncbi:hypothetical protein [Amycolatopsis suaedae]|uniref:Uncharacterized protein n=1 Tax=Amycolatopsis suaedae TaxID=2510978 RepID=A0A4Q7JCF5_9PSEU|nr:hypothetical protein [Amycolatopsis suaedae]RZQ64712.1 hypothetical protein EWH70_07415 [Amycolatopsis suaedae]
MITDDIPTVERHLRTVLLVVGPVVFAASTFFWLPGGTYGATAGALMVAGLVLWAYGLLALVDGLRTRLPRYAALVRLLVVGGLAGGVTFGVQGVYDEVFALTRETSVGVLEPFGWQADVVFYWTGPLFPLALLALGVGLGHARLVPWWPAVALGVCGVAFPLSRIPRETWVAHAVDGLLVVVFAYLAFRSARAKTSYVI